MQVVIEKVKKRDISIDILKFFAVFLIINSHMDALYVKYGILATGGAIGDALFLFCSGYTLFWDGRKRFDNWYKKRISRIYPSVFACLAVAMVLEYETFDKLTIVKIGGGEFVIAIMVYYVLLFAVRCYCIRQIEWILVVTIGLTLVAYCFFPYKYETGERGIYGITTPFRWIPYFAMMLVGAWMGMKVKEGTCKVKARLSDFVLMLLCLLAFYAIQFAAKKNVAIAPWQIVTLPFLVGIVYYFWRCCNAECFRRIYARKRGRKVVMLVSGLCLESYLIQFYLFTDKLNWLFPLNIPLMMLFILAMAYICRCFARILSQTFRTEDYEWKKVFEI